MIEPDVLRKYLSLKLIPDIVDTCNQCRSWAKPLPANVASVSVAEEFNHQVEADIMNYKKEMIWHMICRCTRWHSSTHILGHDQQILLDAINDSWITTWGPMKELIIDGERGVVRPLLTAVYLTRRGIKLVTRAPNQHANHIERRGALLRDQLHKIDDQLAVEGIRDIPFKHRLAEATFAGNALITINGSTPYNNVTGRVPLMLPPINQPDAEDNHKSALRDWYGILIGSVK